MFIIGKFKTINQRKNQPMTRITCILLFNLFLISQLFGQAQPLAPSPYKVSFKKDLSILAVGGTIGGLGLYANSKAPIFTTDEIISLDPQDINGFDRWATRQNSNTAQNLSDALLMSSFMTPVFLMAGKKSRKDVYKISLMYFEAHLINGGLTGLGKAVFQRARPLVFNPEFPQTDKLKKNAKKSFPSGHTSATATSTFFVAKVFSDYYSDSKLKPYVWTAAAVIPATTGLMRVLAGKHYPTDVITGYAIGASLGVLIPHLHKIKKPDALVEFDLGLNSAQLVWHLNRKKPQPAPKSLFLSE